MSRRNPHLDMVRALAALGVMFSHARAFLMLDYDAGTLSRASAVWYFLTGLGHECVIIFFVLSGYFISASVASKLSNWSWRSYVIDRLVRLWSVLLPSLALTFVVDQLGRLLGYTYYSGYLHSYYGSGPDSNGVDLGIASFIGNLLFQQTIHVNPYGDNGPLWSLAYEASYYAAFPALCLVFAARPAHRDKVLLLMMIIIIFANAGFRIFAYFFIWLIGVLAFTLVRSFKPSGTVNHSIVYLWPSLISVAIALCISKSRTASSPMFEYLTSTLLGFCIASLIYSCEKLACSATKWYRKLSSWLSDISYSLYLVHFPFMAFLVATLQIKKQPFNPQSIAAVGLLSFLSLLYAWAFYWLFERNTSRIRAAVHKQFGLGDWTGKQQ